jgi:LacI family transcriptional regulator
MTTIRDVARLAGVGIGTVSRVTNQRSHVKTATRAKVLQAIEQLQYTPDPIARSMISHYSRTCWKAKEERHMTRLKN